MAKGAFSVVFPPSVRSIKTECRISDSYSFDLDTEVRTFFINLLLPNKMEVQMLQVMESNLIDTDMLIGMDVINLCDFAITHPDSKTLFSFDMSNTHIIDFTKE